MVFFEFAKRNVRLNWLRSVLAVIGVVIGVVAISSMGVLGNSLVLSVSDTLTNVGDTIVVYPHSGAMGGGMGVRGQQAISDRDVEEITRVVAPNVAIPIRITADRLIVGRETGAATIYGLRPKDIPSLLEKREGSYLRSSEGIMVGPRLAENLKLRVGSRVMIGENGQGMRVVGILEERGIGFDINPDFAIIVSDTWFAAEYGRNDWDQVIVKVKDLPQIARMKDALEERFNRREEKIDILDTKQILQTILDAFNRISLFTVAIGGISLIVAGVSIMNVMMMSVTERTREVGILRSLGATRSGILRMFLYESLLLGLIGSGIGGLLSFAGGYFALAVMLQETTYLFAPSSLLYIPFGMSFGIGVSVLSGLYPAWKASKLKPIEALRHE